MQKSAKTTISLIRAIILDFSGTMFDDIFLTWNIVNEVLVKFDKRPIGFDEFRENFELPYYQIFLKYGLGKKEAKETSLQVYRERYMVYEHLTRSFDQIKSLIESLSKAGYLLGIVSQTPRELLDYQLQKMGLGWMIPYSIAKGEVPDEKPLPMPLFEMMERLGEMTEIHDLSRHQVIYVGDTYEDWLCAYYAGVKCALVANDRSYHTLERLSEAEPDYGIISNLEELEQILVPEIGAMM